MNNSIKLRIGISGSKYLFVDICNIIYFSASGRNTIAIHTNDIKTELRVSHSLGQLEKLLTEYAFVRAGRSYLINMKYLHEVDIIKKTCTLSFESKNIVLNSLSDNAVKSLTKADSYEI